MDHTIADDEESLLQVISVNYAVQHFGFASTNQQFNDLVFAVSHTHDLSVWNIAESSQLGTVVNRTQLNADYLIRAMYTPLHHSLYCFAGTNAGGLMLAKYVAANNSSAFVPVTVFANEHTERIQGVWASENVRLFFRKNFC